MAIERLSEPELESVWDDVEQQGSCHDRSHAANPSGNRSNKGPKSADADAARDTSAKEAHTQNTAEQGDTANIKQNTTNKGFFQGRRVK